MKINDLEVLFAVSQLNSLNEVAEKLHKTQPAISQAIKRLETELGFKILNRSEYRLSLTEQGKHFLIEAEKLLQCHDDLKLLANEYANGCEAKLNICYESMCYQQSYNDVVADTFNAFSATEIVISSGPRFEALKQVNAGHADLGIGPWFDIFHATGELESMPIGHINFGLVAKKGLLPKHIAYDDLKHYTCLEMFESNFAFDSERLAYTNNAKKIKMDDISAIKAFLLSGVGFAFTILDHCQKEIDDGLLEIIHVTDREDVFSTEVHVFRKRTGHHGPVARDIWQRFTALVSRDQ